MNHIVCGSSGREHADVEMWICTFESSILNVLFPLLDAVEFGSLRWARRLKSLELLVRVRMRTLLRLHPLAIVVELLQTLYEARMING